MIIVEGCDNSGKSTLVSKLTKDLGLIAIKNCHRPEKPEAISSWVTHINGLGYKHFVILDRISSISELVYGETLREGAMIDLRQSLLSLLLLDPILIYCRPSTEAVLNFDPNIPQMKGVIEKATKLLAAYDEYMEAVERLGLKFLRWDYEKNEYRDLRNAVENHMGD